MIILTKTFKKLLSILCYLTLYNRLGSERLARDKRFSLTLKITNYIHKKFYNTRLRIENVANGKPLFKKKFSKILIYDCLPFTTFSILSLVL